MDWQQLIIECLEHMRAVDIAKRTGVSRQLVTELKHGRVTEPRGMKAVNLYLLHQELNPQEVLGEPSAIHNSTSISSDE